MAYEQVRSVLNHAEQFHNRVAHRYDRLAATAAQPRCEMLLTYFARHQRQIAKTVASYLRTAPDRVLGTWVATTHETQHLAERAERDLPGVTPDCEDDVLDLGRRTDDRAIEVYRELADRDAPDWVTEAFRNLLDLENNHQRRMAAQGGRLADL